MPRTAIVWGSAIIVFLMPGPACLAETGLKNIGKGLKEIISPSGSSPKRPNSSPSKPSGRKPSSGDGRLFLETMLIGSDIVQHITGSSLGKGGNLAIDLAQAAAVAKLEGEQFQLFPTSRKTEVARRTSQQLHHYNSARRAQYQELHNASVDPAKIEKERAAMSEMKTEVNSRLDMIRKSVEEIEPEDRKAALDLRDAANELAENIVDLEDLDGLFRALLRSQNSISREYVGSVLLEL